MGKNLVKEGEFVVEQEEGGPNYISCLFLLGSQRFENSPNPRHASAYFARLSNNLLLVRRHSDLS